VTLEEIPYTSPNEVMVIGTLEGVAYSPCSPKSQRHRPGCRSTSHGTGGVLRITNPRGFENEHDDTASSSS
jgi:hypothetical protein